MRSFPMTHIAHETFELAYPSKVLLLGPTESVQLIQLALDRRGASFHPDVAKHPPNHRGAADGNHDQRVFDPKKYQRKYSDEQFRDASVIVAKEVSLQFQPLPVELQAWRRAGSQSQGYRPLSHRRQVRPIQQDDHDRDEVQRGKPRSHRRIFQITMRNRYDNLDHAGCDPYHASAAHLCLETGRSLLEFLNRDDEFCRWLALPDISCIVGKRVIAHLDSLHENV